MCQLVMNRLIVYWALLLSPNHPCVAKVCCIGVLLSDNVTQWGNWNNVRLHLMLAATPTLGLPRAVCATVCILPLQALPLLCSRMSNNMEGVGIRSVKPSALSSSHIMAQATDYCCASQHKVVAWHTPSLGWHVTCYQQ